MTTMMLMSNLNLVYNNKWSQTQFENLQVYVEERKIFFISLKAVAVAH
jgi:hypothetical protein